jgi:hypothetical protein
MQSVACNGLVDRTTASGERARMTLVLEQIVRQVFAEIANAQVQFKSNSISGVDLTCMMCL